MFIGKVKLGYTEKEIGHMTFMKWNALYQAYKDDYDLEFIMKEKKLRYKDLINVNKNEKENVIAF